MLYLLDSSAILNNPRFTFDEKHRYACTFEVLEELKSFETRALAENALKRKLLRVYRPKHKYRKNAEKIVAQKGFTRMSKADISVLALAMQFKSNGKEFIVLTDDYSIQNFLAMLGIAFSSIIQGKIKQTIAFVKYCPACLREFRKGNSPKECPDCGIELKTKRVVAKVRKKA